MKRTVAALYETRDVADRVVAALKAQGLGGEVEIRDSEHDDAKQHRHGLGGWLNDLFGGHDDHRVYADGLTRGHVLVVAKVDELNETRAATVMDAAAVNFGDAQSEWRREGGALKTAAPEGGQGAVVDADATDALEGVTAGTAYTSTFGGVRSYTL